MRMKIVVTEKDVEKAVTIYAEGQTSLAHCCPIFQALKRRNVLIEAVGCNTMVFDNGCDIINPPAAYRFVLTWKPSQPFVNMLPVIFSIDVPDDCIE